jgi:hypothetical protein
MQSPVPAVGVEAKRLYPLDAPPLGEGKSPQMTDYLSHHETKKNVHVGNILQLKDYSRAPEEGENWFT